ncbi:MAG: hypothetical protein Tsb002_02160 [Wenzhouxiangellaceae bacterium]
MQLLPDREQGRPFALILLATLLVLIYFVFFHWFVLRHLEYADTLEVQRERLGSIRSRVAQRPLLEARLEQLRENRQDDALFLQESNFDTAAAQLTRRLKDTIGTQAEDAERCQVVSNQNMRPRDRERFEKVVVKVRMRCTLPDFVKVMGELENGLPLILIDNLNIYQQVVMRSTRARRGLSPSNLDIRFDMLGYLRQSGETP